MAASSPQGRFGEADEVDGRVVSATEAWGKHLFHRYEDDERWLHVHLGLFGRFRDGRLPAPEPRGALRLRLLTDSTWLDLRGPTACELVTEAQRDALLARLGPDPLRADADPGPATARLRRSRAAIGTLLMDQSFVAGVGNVYRSEVLFRHGLDPWLAGREVDPVVWEAMWADLQVLLADGVRAGRIVTTHADDRERPFGRPRKVDSHYVYGRASLPCRRCSTTVRRADLTARTIFWCPVCQPAGG